MKRYRYSTQSSLDANIFPTNFQTFQMTYTTGREVIDDPYHVPVVNPMLTRSLPAFFTAIHDEVVQYFTESITFNGNGTSQISIHTVSPPNSMLHLMQNGPQFLRQSWHRNSSVEWLIEYLLVCLRVSIFVSG